MNYRCPECTHRFSDQTALCNNWRIREKSFGCPQCQTFFLKKTVGWRNRWYITEVIGIVGVILPGFFLFIHALPKGDYATTFYGVVILASGVALYVLHWESFKKARVFLQKVNFE